LADLLRRDERYGLRVVGKPVDDCLSRNTHLHVNNHERMSHEPYLALDEFRAFLGCRVVVEWIDSLSDVQTPHRPDDAQDTADARIVWVLNHLADCGLELVKIKALQ
jgi:hypothetical protein